MAEVKVLIEGYTKQVGLGKVKAEGTITLIKSVKNIIIDTGNVGSAKKIIERLNKENLKPEDINFVINTHGDLDHVGNNNLFINATFIGFGSVCKGNEFSFFEKEFVIDKDVKIIKTPGHSMMDISITANTSHDSIIVIAGDIFENEIDYNGEKAKNYSINWGKQLESRKKILELADYIIPGHGGMFKVKK